MKTKSEKVFDKHTFCNSVFVECKIRQSKKSNKPSAYDRLDITRNVKI